MAICIDAFSLQNVRVRRKAEQLPIEHMEGLGVAVQKSGRGGLKAGSTIYNLCGMGHKLFKLLKPQFLHLLDEENK